MGTDLKAMRDRAVRRLRKMVKENRIVRGMWESTDSRGRRTACLLAAMSKKVANMEDSGYCPAYLMPSWMASVTVKIDDDTSLEHWNGFIQEYSDLIGEWEILTEADWEWVRNKFGAFLFRTARESGALGGLHTTSMEDFLEHCAKEALKGTPYPKHVIGEKESEILYKECGVGMYPSLCRLFSQKNYEHRVDLSMLMTRLERSTSNPYVVDDMVETLYSFLWQRIEGRKKEMESKEPIEHKDIVVREPMVFLEELGAKTVEESLDALSV